jgi:hypothetical protein
MRILQVYHDLRRLFHIKQQFIKELMVRRKAIKHHVFYIEKDGEKTVP